MKLRHLIQSLGRGCSVAALFGAAMASDALLTNTTSFRIPFAIDHANGPQVSGAAILFASVNGDPVMERIQTVDVNSGGFQFDAPSDGHYGFAVRLIDSTGKPIGNDGRLLPEMEVIVDTIAPEISFQLLEIAPGELSVTWIASETGISPGSLKVEYAEGTDGRWKEVGVRPGASGYTVIKSQPGTSVSVRGFVTDLAGNQGTGSGQLVLNARSPQVAAGTLQMNSSNGRSSQGVGASNSDGPSLLQSNQAVGPSPFYRSSVEPAVAYSASVSGVKVPDSQPSVVSPQLPHQQQSVEPQVPSVPQAMPTLQSAAVRQPSRVNKQESVFVLSGPATHLGSPDFTVYYPTPTINKYRQPFNAGYAPASVPGTQTSSFSNNTFSTSTYPDALTSSSAMTSMMNAVGDSTGSHQVVNNRVFDIDYQVEDVGPSGVGAVELFVTENNGREWFKYGSDADLASPFQVDTRGEGTFGFAVRVKSGLGFSEPPPQPGELPNIIVVVDQTPPIAELAVPQVVVDGGGRIRMSWRLSDPNISATPVRLEYAASTSGPWTPLFDWQVDQGGCEMPIQSGMANRLHFRLLVRDVAGNVTAVQTNQPVLIDQQCPTAKLLRVQSVSRTQR